MTPEQIAQEAREALAAETRMTLMLPWRAKRLPGFPRGELLCENHGGTKCFSYDPQRVLEWLESNELIGIQPTLDSK